jgi:hypothetical protein
MDLKGRAHRDPNPRGDRQKRLAEALKANLKRRKEQRRERAKSAPEQIDSVKEAET